MYLFDHEINLQAMIASYYLGKGFKDVENTISFLEVPGGKSWSRSFHDNMEILNENFIQLYEIFIKEGFSAEISATIHVKLLNKFTNK